MAFLNISNVAIRGISACVPPDIEKTRDIEFYTPEEADKVIETIGVVRKHIVAKSGITASDLCFKAAEKLIDELGWERDSIDLICNVTQTSDYITHPNVYLLHERLGLKTDCMCLDLYQGCPGWAIGLLTVSSLVSHGAVKRCILLDGDTSSAIPYATDHESRPLFGDCGTATALEFDENTSELLFETGTRSSEGKALIRQRGGYREPHTLDTLKRHLAMLSGDLPTEEEDNFMDGMSVFSFGISAPPKSIKALCEHNDIDIDSIDKLVLHQANKFMLTKIAKKLKIGIEKVPMSLQEYGNCTSACIPLTIVSQCAEEYRSKNLKTIACGFGTGLAWASVFMQTDKLVIPDVLIY